MKLRVCLYRYLVFQTQMDSTALDPVSVWNSEAATAYVCGERTNHPKM